jgi:hypothetical protein
MNGKDLMKQAGKVEVNLGPLLVILGVAMSASDGDVCDYADMLFADLEAE